MKNLKLPEEQREKLIVSVLSDAIILGTLADSIKGMGGYMDLEMYYSGYNNAILLLGLPEPKDTEEEEKILDPIKEMLHIIFYDAVEANSQNAIKQRIVPEKLAKHIFKDWKHYLNKNCSIC